MVSGKEENQNISGNICELVIGKDSIKVFDMLGEDGMGKCCEVTTDEIGQVQYQIVFIPLVLFIVVLKEFQMLI